MYFSSEGREELVETLDRLLIAKRLLSHKGMYFPDKEKFYSNTCTDVGKLEFFAHALVYGLNARVDFDPDEEREIGDYDEIFKFDIFLVELDQFNKLIRKSPKSKEWKDRLQDLITKHLHEVHADGFMEAVMDVQLGELGNVLHAGVECMAYSTCHTFYDGFLKFQKDLVLLIAEIEEEKGRVSA